MNPYTTLNVRRNATKRTIEKAYRRLAMVNHPDRGGNRETFDNIDLAYRVLMNDDARKRFDETGECRAPQVDNSRSALMESLNQVFAAVMQDMLRTGRDPAEHDVIALMKQLISKSNQGIAEQMTANEKAEQVLQKTLGRFTTPDGVDMMDGLIGHHLAQVQGSIVQLRKMKEMNLSALKYLKKCGYRFEPPRVMEIKTRGFVIATTASSTV